MNQSSPRPATGTQYQIQAGGARALVTELAAGLRLYERAGVALTESYPEERIAPGAGGILLAPWANRIRDGKWLLHGAEQRLDITEPSRGNASHGLLRNTGYHLVGSGEHFVELAAGIFPQHGYPFHLTHTARYELDGAGHLRVTQTLRNEGTSEAPFGLGAHPYLRLGDVPSEDLRIRVAAATRVLTDERLNAAGLAPVSGDTDLRGGRRAGELDIDVALTDLEPARGPYRHTLTAPDGRSVTLWAEEVFSFVHVFVTDQYPGRPTAIALEPMTAPADAFNSGTGLRWLAPGASFSGSWGIQADLG